MAKERLTLYDKYGNVVDYDVSTEDVTLDNEGGKSLKQKLAEVDDGIGEQVKKVVFNGTTKNASNGTIDLGNQMQPDWNESSQSYPSFIRNKPNVVTGIRIGSSGGTMEPTNGVVTLPESGGTAECDPAMSSTSEKPVQNKVIKAYVDAVSQRIDILIGSGNVQGAIDTFNEVVAFLNGINSSDTLAAKLALKVNSSDLQNYATKDELTSGLSGKQDTLTFDNAPTAGSNNPVKSGGIKTAIDQVTPTIDANGKWVIGGVTTTHDAHGPMGNITIEDADDMVALIVNDLTTGGQANFLSAEMGKALLSVLLQIFGNLGEYAFPNGKPTLNFNTQVLFHISYSTSDLHVTYEDGEGGTAPTTVELLGRLEIQLGTDDDLYVINESAVKVFVGGTEVSNAYDPTTDKIVIPEVYGNVVIIAQAWTYFGYGEQNSPLVLMFDGKNQGETAGQWKDLANTSRSVALTGGYTKNSDNVQFDGTGYGSGNFVDDVTYDNSTAECVIKQTTAVVSGGSGQVILLPGKTGAALLALFYQTSDSKVAWSTIAQDAADSSYSQSRTSFAFSGSVNNKYSISYYGNKMMQNGSPVSARSVAGKLDTFNTANHLNKTFIGAQITGANAVLGFKGSIYCVRLYSRTLTDAEVLQNWKVDQKRFNI